MSFLFAFLALASAVQTSASDLTCHGACSAAGSGDLPASTCCFFTSGKVVCNQEFSGSVNTGTQVFNGGSSGDTCKAEAAKAAAENTPSSMSSSVPISSTSSSAASSSSVCTTDVPPKNNACCAPYGTCAPCACASNAPICVGYVAGSAWGQCKADCIPEGTDGNKPEYTCPPEAPTCEGYEYNVKWGRCTTQGSSRLFAVMGGVGMGKLSGTHATLGFVALIGATFASALFVQRSRRSLQRVSFEEHIALCEEMPENM